MNDFTIKPAESTDNPDEIMAAIMPAANEQITPGWNAPPSKHPTVPCPMCGKACLAIVDLLQEVAKLIPGRVVPTCTMCGLKSNATNGRMQKWLEEQGKTPEQVFNEVLKRAEANSQE